VVPKQLYQHLTAPLSPDDLVATSPDELRARRADCEGMEAAISYARRALHGRLDIVHADLRRRAEGRDDPRLEDLVAQLPEILAETQPVGASGSLRILVSPEPSAVVEDLMALVDEVAGPNALTHLAQFDDEAVSSAATRLAELEHEFSVARRQLHHNIDLLQAELSSRYGRGELSVETLLA
jgi:hypothetical protein